MTRARHFATQAASTSSRAPPSLRCRGTVIRCGEQYSIAADDDRPRLVGAPVTFNASSLPLIEPAHGISMHFIGALLVASASTCTVPPSEVTAQAALPYAAFDSRDGPFGGRTLVAAGCTDSAVSLLVHYSEANQSRLASAQRREVAFHIGQALAMANRAQEAIGPLEQALDSEAPPEWVTYVKATLAFPWGRQSS